MQKQDLTKTTITVNFEKKNIKTGKSELGDFTINLQKWIKMTPEEQEQFIKGPDSDVTVVSYDTN